MTSPTPCMTLFLHIAHTDRQAQLETGSLPKGSILNTAVAAQPLTVTDFAERAVRLLMGVIMIDEQADLTGFLVPLEAATEVSPACFILRCRIGKLMTASLIRVCTSCAIASQL